MSVLTKEDEEMLLRVKESKLLRIARGLEILNAISKGFDTAAEHDVFFAGPSEAKAQLSERERLLLEKLGWFYDTDVDRYCIFT